MATIPASNSWLVIDDGRIVSAHRQPHIARGAAKKLSPGAAVLVLPGRGVTLSIGQRVRDSLGTAVPI